MRCECEDGSQTIEAEWQAQRFTNLRVCPRVGQAGLGSGSHHHVLVELLRCLADDDRWSDACEVGETRHAAESQQEKTDLRGHVGMKDRIEEVLVLLDGSLAVDGACHAKANGRAQHVHRVVLDRDVEVPHHVGEELEARVIGTAGPQCLALAEVQRGTVFMTESHQPPEGGPPKLRDR